MIKAYASYFSSYLLFNIKNSKVIEKIILYGSASRDEVGKNSDIDIFIDINKTSKSFENEVNKIVEDFYKSREGLIFKSKGINNKINVIVGKLADFKDLSQSISSTGIILYGKFISMKNKEGRKYSIFFWEGIDKNRGAFLNKVYGFRSGGKKYEGIIQEFEGKKLGKSSLMIPIEFRDEILKLFKHHKVNAKVIDVYG